MHAFHISTHAVPKEERPRKLRHSLIATLDDNPLAFIMLVSLLSDPCWQFRPAKAPAADHHQPRINAAVKIIRPVQ
jgi:hypothetical protein